MKKRLIVAMAMVIAAWVVQSLPVNAASTVSPELITRVRARCTENLATLNRLHQTDAFLRNDRGNLYRTISDKLMVPLNRRLASNQLNGGPLVTTAASYNDYYNQFREAYIEYDNALSKVLEINCNREPVSFYNALLDAREKRTEVSRINLLIKESVRQYGSDFATFKAEYESKNK